MPSCTCLRPLLVGSFFLVPPLHAALAQPPAMPTDAEMRERSGQLEQTKDQPARLEALQWLRKHAAAKNAGLAIPVLERTIRDDPLSKARDEAVLALFYIAKKHKLPCPLALVHAISDKEVSVRQDAAALVLQFTGFAPGTLDLALRAAWSEDADVRCYALNLLALAAPRDEKVLAVLNTAQNDRSFQVRHNVRCYRFQADDKLDEFLAWLIRVQEDDGVLQPIPKDDALRKRDENLRALFILGSAILIHDWCEKRPDDLADALLKLLDHESPVIRHGAVRLIGVAAVKTDLSTPKPGDAALSKVPSFLFPESESGRSEPGKKPKPPLLKSKVAPCLDKRKVRERLEKLSENDPHYAVRAAALATLDRLSRLQTKP